MMSSFAGIYRLSKQDNDCPLNQDVIDTIKNNISRANDKIDTFRDPRFFLEKLDVGAYPNRAMSIGEEGAAAVAGLPLLDPSSMVRPSRTRDLAVISKKLNENCLDVLGDCQGSYALCNYRSLDGKLTLAVDKIGIRPIYYHIGKDYLFFSTTLRVLEAIEQIPKRMDVQAVAEMAAFGYPLSDRTPYSDIKTLLNGECLIADAGGVRRSIYFRWDEIEPTKLEPHEFREQVYREFVRAVACRSSYDRTAAAMLSGGLDTRCIVTILKNLGKNLFTASYETPGYLDGIYANQYAERIGSKHLSKLQPAVPTWNMWIQCLKDLKWTENKGPEFPKLVFSGDGGSVCMGFVLIDDNVFDLMRQNRLDLAVQRLLENRVLPRNFMPSKAYTDIHERLIEGVRTELERIHSPDRGRDLHIFFLENDQRRHLYPFYESIDEHELEYLLPFYDGRFLETAVSGPAEEFLRHKFYHKWLEQFPKEFASVPWQTYPGHEKCPVGDEMSARNQWETKRQDRFIGKSTELYQRCQDAVANPCFPAKIIDRKRVRLALALHRLKLRNYNHVFQTCTLFHDYYAKCKGKVEFVP